MCPKIEYFQIIAAKAKKIDSARILRFSNLGEEVGGVGFAILAEILTQSTCHF